MDNVGKYISLFRDEAIYTWNGRPFGAVERRRSRRAPHRQQPPPTLPIAQPVDGHAYGQRGQVGRPRGDLADRPFQQAQEHFLLHVFGVAGR